NPAASATVIASPRQKACKHRARHVHQGPSAVPDPSVVHDLKEIGRAKPAHRVPKDVLSRAERVLLVVTKVVMPQSAAVTVEGAVAVVTDLQVKVHLNHRLREHAFYRLSCSGSVTIQLRGQC